MALAGACGEGARDPEAPRRAAPAAPQPELSRGAWGDVRSARLDLAFSLPDAARWSVDDARSPWLVASHAPTSSSLVVRVWHEGDRVRRAQCEERARASRTLPVRERADILERRRIDVPPGFDTVVEVGLVAKGPSAPIEAFAMAFGGRARRCFAWVFTTAALGPDAERAIADRLAAMTDGALASLALESELSFRPPPR